MRTASCPNCGAEIRFLWSGAVQTTCPACRSILVRRDVDLERVGVVGDVPPSSSPIQIGTEGRWHGDAFTVVGRIIYRYERGHWSEWHIRLADGTSGWLSDAQGEYALTREQPGQGGAAPAAESLRPGSVVMLGTTAARVTTVTRAHYAGVEGELPFEYWDKTVVPFVDVELPGGRFGTIDYSETPPLVFVGEYAAFEALHLAGLREVEAEGGPTVTGVGSLSCPQCGAAVERIAGDLTQTIACPACTAILDATHPSLRILQKFQQRMQATPLIPLGTTGRLGGVEWRVIGYQVRSIRVEGLLYSWREYVLWNRERGFRYLTEYDGHWNDVVALKETPRVLATGTQSVLEYNGTQFKHFQSAQAETSFVLGEFPWEVRSGDRADAHDFVAPPRVLSREDTEGEVTWSLGTYVEPKRIWEAFSLPGAPRTPTGVYANQPNPHAGLGGAYARIFGLFLVAIALLTLVRLVTARNERVFSERYAYNESTGDTAAFVTPSFRLAGGPSNVEVRISTDLENDWAYFNLALINGETGTAYDFGREVAYYRGVDSDGSWSEGSRRDRAMLGNIPAGSYYLRVEPEKDFGRPPIGYSIELRRDVPRIWPSALAILLLGAPVIFALAMEHSFESRRWAESDHAPVSEDDDGDDDGNDDE